MMRQGTLITLACSILAYGALVGQASGQARPATGAFSYSYLEGAYQAQERDRDSRSDEEVSGGRLRASVAVHPNVFAIAESAYMTDETDVNTDSAGPGIRLGVMPALDLYGVIAGAYRDRDRASSGEDDTGYRATAGIRHECLLSENLHYAWEFRYHDLDAFGDWTDLRARGVLAAAERWDAVGELQINDAGEDNELGLALGARYNF